jgi:CheY-like chemotaxis protein
MTLESRQVSILLVEDNESDAEKVRRELARKRVTNSLQHAESGEEAMKFLLNVDTEFDVVLLDLHLPGMSGHEVLKQIRLTDRLKNLKVVVLTTSSAEEDLLSTYEHSANAYIVKPFDFDQFVDSLEVLGGFSLAVVHSEV